MSALHLRGSLTALITPMRADGSGLDLARFDQVTLDDWLDATVELSGRGAGF